MATNNVVFSKMINGFNVPIDIAKNWVNNSNKVRSNSSEADSISGDPNADWIPDEMFSGYSINEMISHLKKDFDIEFKEMREKEEKSGLKSYWYNSKNYYHITKENFEIIIKLIDKVIDRLLKEFPNGPYIIFGRDCWLLSLRMMTRYQKPIPHTYLEGASRTIIGEQDFWNTMNKIPCPKGSVLIDTGFTGSIPIAFLDAHGISYGTDCGYHIKMINANETYPNRQLKWTNSKSDRSDLLEYLEHQPKFFNRPTELQSNGHPIMRVSATAKRALLYYLFFMEQAYVSSSIVGNEIRESICGYEFILTKNGQIKFKFPDSVKYQIIAKNVTVEKFNEFIEDKKKILVAA